MKMLTVAVVSQTLVTVAVGVMVLRQPQAAPVPAAGGHGAAAESGPAPPPVDTKPVVQALLAGNQRFTAGRPSAHAWAKEREKVAASQAPKVMLLSCSDSRVPVEHVFDQGIGDVFVVRTAGNVADPVAIGSLEYGAEHLHAQVLVVLGHERCGAVTAAVQGGPMPTANLEAIMSSIKPAVESTRDIPEDARLQATVEANARNQAKLLAAKSPVLRHLVEQKQLTIIAALYDLDSGAVQVLE